MFLFLVSATEINEMNTSTIFRLTSMLISFLFVLALAAFYGMLIYKFYRYQRHNKTLGKLFADLKPIYGFVYLILDLYRKML